MAKYNYSDLIGPDVNKNLDDLIAKLKELKDAVIAIAEANKKKLEVTRPEDIEALKQQARDTAKLKEELKAIEAAERKLIQAREKKIQQEQQINELMQQTESIMSKEAKTLQELMDKNNQLVKIRKNIDTSTAAGKASYDKLTAAIADNIAKLKEEDKQIGVHVRNVGNYKSALDGTQISLGEMKKALRELRNMSFSGLSPEEITNVRQQMAGLTKQIRDFQEQTRAASEFGLPGLIFGIQGLISGAQILTGTLNLLGVENERLEKSMMQLIGITQALATFEHAYSKGKFKTMAVQAQSMAMSVKEQIMKLRDIVVTKAQMGAEAARQTMTTRGVGITKAAAAAQLLWNRALMSFPGTMLIVGLAAVATAIYALTRSRDEHIRKLTEEQERLNTHMKVQDAVKEKTVEEVASLQVLQTQLKEYGDNQKVRVNLIQQLNQNYSEYLPNLLAETASYEDLAAALDLVVEGVKKRIIAEEAMNLVRDQIKKRVESELAIAKTEAEIIRLQSGTLTQDEQLSIGQNKAMLDARIAQLQNFVAIRKNEMAQADVEIKRVTDLFSEQINFMLGLSKKTQAQRQQATKDIIDDIDEVELVIDDATQAEIDKATKAYEAKKRIREWELKEEERARRDRMDSQIEYDRWFLNREKTATEQAVAAADKKREEEKQKQKERIDYVTDQAFKAYEARYAKQVEMAAKQIAALDRNITLQEELAAKGLKNSLAAEKLARAEAELEKNRALRRQEAAQKVAAFWNLLANSKDPQEAILKFGVGEAFAQLIGGLPAFEEGGETPGKPTLAVVGEKGTEFVHTAQSYAKYKPEIQAIHNNSFEQLIEKRYPRTDIDVMALAAEMKATREAIERNLPNVTGYFDKNNREIVTVLKYSHSKKTERQKLPRL